MERSKRQKEPEKTDWVWKEH